MPSASCPNFGHPQNHSIHRAFSLNQTGACPQTPSLAARKRRIPCTRRLPTLRMAQSAQNPVIKQQRVIIPNKHGEKLVGLLHETVSKEIVILCHGFLCNKMENLAVALEKEGITAFRFDFSGNGESEGSFEIGNQWKEAEDLRAVVEHFNAVNRVTVAVLGHSKGGCAVLLYASNYHNICAVVNLSARYNLKRGIKEMLGENYMEKLNKDGFIDGKDKAGTVTFRLTKGSLMEILNINMQEVCLNIDKNCRVLTVHGTNDEINPVEDAVEFSKVIPNHELHIIEGANHGYSLHQIELADVVLRFIKSVLQENKDK